MDPCCPKITAVVDRSTMTLTRVMSDACLGKMEDHLCSNLESILCEIKADADCQMNNPFKEDPPCTCGCEGVIETCDCDWSCEDDRPDLPIPDDVERRIFELTLARFNVWRLEQKILKNALEGPAKGSRGGGNLQAKSTGDGSKRWARTPLQIAEKALERAERAAEKVYCKHHLTCGYGG